MASPFRLGLPERGAAVSFPDWWLPEGPPGPVANSILPISPGPVGQILAGELLSSPLGFSPEGRVPRQPMGPRDTPSR